MDLNEVENLGSVVNNKIKYALPRISAEMDSSGHWVQTLRVSLEAKSRLVLRYQPEDAVKTLREALSLHQSEPIIRIRWLHGSVSNLLARSWEALPREYRELVILDVLEAPIGQGVRNSTDVSTLADPAVVIVDDKEETPFPDRGSEDESRIVDAIEEIERGLRFGGDYRQRASLRLAVPGFRRCLTDQEERRLADALWAIQREEEGLPADTELYDWVFLTLPEPKKGVAEEKFRETWLKREVTGDAEIDELFWTVGMALNSLRLFGKKLFLKETENRSLVKAIGQWKGIRRKPPTILAGSDNYRGVRGLQFLLLWCALPKKVARHVYKKAIHLDRETSPMYGLYAGLAKALPEKTGELGMLLRVALSSDDQELAKEAIGALDIWVRFSAEPEFKVPNVPDDLITEIGVIIATRRRNVLSGALGLARLVFVEGSDLQRKLLVESTLHGLRYLMEELSYRRFQPDTQDDDIPILRWGCVRVALAMKECGYSDDQAIIDWIETAAEDPLPEARNAEAPRRRMHEAE
jgi:hypothetical protein